MGPDENASYRFSGRTGIILAGLSVVWFLWVFLRYFTRPFDLLSLTAMFASPAGLPNISFGIIGGSLGIVALSAAILAALTALGYRMAGVLALEIEDPDTGYPVCLGLGIAAANAFWVGLGLAGLWQGPVLVTGAGLLFLQAVPILLKREIRGFPVMVRETLRKTVRLSWPARVLLVLAALTLALGLAHGVVPETFYDSLVYHLAVPSYWMLHHGITDFPTNFFSNYPYGGEMFMFNGLLAGPVTGSEVAKVLNVAALAACALLAFGWVRKVSRDADMGVLAGAMILTTPLLAMNVWSTQLEGILCFFLLLFLYLSSEALSRGDAGTALAAGLMAGMSLSVKYTSVLGVGAGVLALLLFSGRRGTFRSWTLMALATLPPVLPWILKNAVFTGNPFFPYLMDWFAGRRLPEAGYVRLLAEQREIHADSLSTWLTLPWRLVMSEPVGPMLLGLVPVVLLFRWRGRVSRTLAWTVILFFASALVVTHHMRFLAAGFVVFDVMVAMVLASSAPWVRRGVGWAAVIAAAMGLLTLANISRHYYSCGGVWQGRETRSAYLERAGVSPYHDLPAWVDGNLPADSVLLVVGDARGYYYGRRFLTNTVFDDPILSKAVRDGLDAAGILRLLKRMGVTHLVVNGLEGLRSAADYRHYELAPDDWTRLEDFMGRGVEPVAFLRQKGVYRVLDSLKDSGVRVLPSPLLLFSGTGTAFVKAVQDREWAEAGRRADEAVRACPTSSFWWEQKAQLVARAGKEKEASDLFRKAEGLGVLQSEGYRQWFFLLEKAGRRAEAAAVKTSAKQWYPNLFK